MSGEDPVTAPVHYDPDARRDTALALKLKECIRREGPVSVAEYMRACLHDPEHGYYRRMPAVGAGGDFVTAPEISQAFGELIGLWCCVVWQQMGSPAIVQLVELGPGRGTLMRDALRAARVVPGFARAARVHLVESNAHLRMVQAETLAAVPAQWHESLATIADGPTIVVANEFLDSCEVHQHVRSPAQWHERGVGLDDTGRLVFLPRMDHCRSLDPAFAERWRHVAPGVIVETQDFGPLLALAARAERAPTAALFIDYGHVSAQAGETLQAVCGHRPEHPLTSPGEADLSVQVDFSHFKTTLESRGAGIDGPLSQAQFLGALGIMERASRLMAANPGQAAAIEAAVVRLMAPGGMGTRFQAIGMRSPRLPTLPGFPAKE